MDCYNRGAKSTVVRTPSLLPRKPPPAHPSPDPAARTGWGDFSAPREASSDTNSPVDHGLASGFRHRARRGLQGEVHRRSSALPRSDHRVCLSGAPKGAQRVTRCAFGASTAEKSTRSRPPQHEPQPSGGRDAASAKPPHGSQPAPAPRAPTASTPIAPAPSPRPRTPLPRAAPRTPSRPTADPRTHRTW